MAISLAENRIEADFDDFHRLWLRACAVYPVLRWTLTVYIGRRLAELQGCPSPDLEAHVPLARLEWFRLGRIPEEERARLVDSIPPRERSVIRAVFSDALADPAARGLTGRKEHGPGDDPIFSQFMLAEKPKPVEQAFNIALGGVYGRARVALVDARFWAVAAVSLLSAVLLSATAALATRGWTLSGNSNSDVNAIQYETALLVAFAAALAIASVFVVYISFRFPAAPLNKGAHAPLPILKRIDFRSVLRLSTTDLALMLLASALFALIYWWASTGGIGGIQLELFAFLSTNSTWAAGFGAAMFALVTCTSLLSSKTKDDVALWLMGAQSEEDWSKTIVNLFDSVFGDRHLSLKCLIRSVIASLTAVMIIWLVMGNAEMIALRMESAQSLGWFLLTALVVNVVADYVSLLETRWFLGRMPRNTFAQIAVLIIDFLISAATIWIAIFLFLRSPLHEGDIETFAEILGIFSVFSVFFYSTFLTSIWLWFHVFSTWFMRLVVWTRVSSWLDVEGKPIRVFSLLVTFCVGSVAFTGTALLGTAFGPRQDGLSSWDRALCSLFQGQVCLEAAKLTDSEEAKFVLMLHSCTNGVTEECLEDIRSELPMDQSTMVRLLSDACTAGDPGACTVLGNFFQRGVAVEQDTFEAARLYRIGCDEGDPTACTNLGIIFQQGVAVERDLAAAARLYRIACESGHALGCLYAGDSYRTGAGVTVDIELALNYYMIGCDLGDVSNCRALNSVSRQ